MKLKIGVLDEDVSYLDKITRAFNARYCDKLEIYAFSELEAVNKFILDVGVDIFLVNSVFDIREIRLPQKCGFAYLVESPGIEAVNGARAICKYQKIDAIYKQILNVYSDDNRGISITADNARSKLLVFSSPCGGTGTSSMAAACAVRFAAKGKKTLYLNFETTGTSDAFFTGEGQDTLGELIFALKSRKANLPLKLESCARCSAEGVFYYAPAKVALDMLDFTAAERKELLDEFMQHTAYDFIILDMDFSLDREWEELFNCGDALIWVGDGSELSNAKLQRAYEALILLDRERPIHLAERLYLVYNKFSNKTGKPVDVLNAKSIGGACRMEHAASKQVLSQLSCLDLFDRFL